MMEWVLCACRLSLVPSLGFAHLMRGREKEEEEGERRERERILIVYINKDSSRGDEGGARGGGSYLILQNTHEVISSCSDSVHKNAIIILLLSLSPGLLKAWFTFFSFLLLNRRLYALFALCISDL